MGSSLPNYFCTEIQYRITFSVPIPVQAVHLFLSSHTDFKLLLVLLNRYFLLVFCFVEFFQKLKCYLATQQFRSRRNGNPGLSAVKILFCSAYFCFAYVCNILSRLTNFLNRQLQQIHVQSLQTDRLLDYTEFR